MHRSQHIISACAIALLGLGAGLSSAQAKGPTGVKVVNGADRAVCTLNVSFFKKTVSAENLLQGQLAPGAAQVVEPPAYGKGRSPNLIAYDCDGQVVMRVRNYGEFSHRPGQVWTLKVKDWGPIATDRKMARAAVFTAKARNRTLLVGAGHVAGVKAPDLQAMAKGDCARIKDRGYQALCGVVLDGKGRCKAVTGPLQAFCKTTFERRGKGCDRAGSPALRALCGLTYQGPKCHSLDDANLKALCKVGVNGASAAHHCKRVKAKGLRAACRAL